MAKQSKQEKLIFLEIEKHGSITKKRADELCKGFYYNNHSKYVSEILSRGVKSRKYKRIGRVCFRKRFEFESIHFKRSNVILLDLYCELN